MPAAYCVKDTSGPGLAATSGPGPAKASKPGPMEAAGPGQRIAAGSGQGPAETVAGPGHGPTAAVAASDALPHTVSLAAAGVPASGHRSHFGFGAPVPRPDHQHALPGTTGVSKAVCVERKLCGKLVSPVAHGRSFLYSWWGSRPTNFELCPTNFLLCPINLCNILMCFGFRMV